MGRNFHRQLHHSTGVVLTVVPLYWTLAPIYPTSEVIFMRVKLVLATLFISAVAALSNPASANTNYNFGLGLSQAFGDTRYEMNAQAEDPGNPGTLVDIRSELVFPLDVKLLTVELGWTAGGSEARGWAAAVEVGTGVTDPTDPMTDSDWVGSKHLAYTESPATMDLIQAAAKVWYRFGGDGGTDFALLFRFDYQRIEQHLVGFDGWRGSLFSDQIWYVSGTAPVIDYEVTYLGPQLGAEAAWGLGTNSRLRLEGTGGVTFASDKDDHLLRGRLSEGDGVGFGAHARLAFDLLPGFVGWRWLTVSLLGDLRFNHAEGEVTQTWYRNEDMPAGTVIEDIPYEMESLQYEFGFQIGVAF